MKMKRFTFVLTLAVLMTSLSFYHKTGKNVSAKTNSKIMLTAQQTLSKPLAAELANTSKSSMLTSTASGKVKSFKFSLNGVKYSLPFKYSDLKKKGWVMEGIKGKTLKSNQYTLSARISNGKMTAYASLVNNSSKTLSMEKCSVGKISIDSYDVDNGTKLTFAKGIKFGSTYKQVIAAYGKPKTLYNGTSLKILTYSSGIYSDMEIQVDPKTNKVISLALENLVSK